MSNRTKYLLMALALIALVVVLPHIGLGFAAYALQLVAVVSALGLLVAAASTPAGVRR